MYNTLGFVGLENGFDVVDGDRAQGADEARDGVPDAGGVVGWLMNGWWRVHSAGGRGRPPPSGVLRVRAHCPVAQSCVIPANV